MVRSRFLPGFSLVLALASVATLSSAQALRPAEWTSDVDLLLEALEAEHPDPFHHTSRAEWAAAARDLKGRLPGLPPHVAILEFRRLLGHLGDGHTYFRTPDAGWGERLYHPLFLRRFASGWYVRTGHREYDALFDKRIVALNGVPMDEVLRRVEPYVGSSNRMRILDVAPQLLRLPQVLHAIGVTAELTPQVSITAVGADGAEVTREVTAIPDWISDAFHDADHAVPSPKPAYREVDGNFDFEHHPEHDATVLYFAEVRDDDDETLAAFQARLFADIDAQGTGRLVIDLRENNGGNLYLLQPLMHTLIRRDYPPGSLYVLIGRDTWSAAMAFAVQLERETSAIFVGEPTPSPPNFWGDTEPIELPASGIVVECSSLWWQFSDPRDQRGWIAPDVPVTETYEDFMAHRDVLLEAVWSHRPQEEQLADGSEESYPVPLHELPATRWQRRSQTDYDASWMH